jgi:hypothetical protein
VTALILISTVTLAAQDYSGFYKDYNATLEVISGGLAVIFALECLLKISAHGLIYGKLTYLRSFWNILDFVIVLQSIAGDVGRLFRLIRVLRPLRTIKRIPTLRMYADALLFSLKGIANVAIFVAFMIFLYGVIGVQLFSG